VAALPGSGKALTVIPARWLGGGAVALVHLLFLLALLLTDKLTLHKTADVKPMVVYRLPEEPSARRTPPSAAGTPSRVTSVPSVASPNLNGPMILVRPEKPLPAGMPSLDLSLRPGAARSLDSLAPLTQEQRLKQFFKDSDAENRQAREPSAGEDCESLLAKDRDIGDFSSFHDPLPAETVCTPRKSAKDLARRNQRFAPQ